MARHPQQENPQQISAARPSQSDFSFIKEKIWLYAFIGIGIVVLGKVVSEGMRGELWNQGVRNMMSAAAFVVLLMVGLMNAQCIYMVLLLYIPFIDAIPGLFGGMHTAINYFNLLSTFTLLCWFVDTVKKNRRFLPSVPATKIASAFIALSLLSFIFAGFRYGTTYIKFSVFVLKRWLDPLLLFFITCGMTYRRDLRRDALVAVFLGAAMFIFVGVKDISEVSHFDWGRRATGAASQANMFGSFCVDYMFLFFGVFLVNHRKKLCWLFLVPFFWGARAVMMSFSRGAYISFIVGTFMISFIKNKALFFFCILLLAFVATNLWVLPKAVQERIEMTVKGPEVYGHGVVIESSAGERIKAWKAILVAIRNRPLLGHGLGMAGTYLRFYTTVKIGDTHNSYLLLAAEHGIPTLIVFVSCMITGAWSAWSVYRKSRDPLIKGAALGFLAGIGGLVINCFFGSHMTTTWEIGYFWILLAIFSAEARQLQDETKQPYC